MTGWYTTVAMAVAIDQCKKEAKNAEKSALPNFGRQKGRIGSVWR